MSYPELVEYIKKARSLGFSDQKIKEKLMSTGWLLGAVTESFLEAGEPEASASHEPLSTSAKDQIEKQNPQQAKPTASLVLPQQGAKTPKSDLPITTSVQKATSAQTPSPVPTSVPKAASGTILPNYKSSSAEPTTVHAAQPPAAQPVSASPPKPQGLSVSVTTPSQGPRATGTPKSHKLALVMTLVFILLLIGVGGAGLAGYFGYFHIPFITPSAKVVWQKFLASQVAPLASDSATSKLLVTYKDESEQLEEQLKSSLPAQFQSGSYVLSMGLEGYTKNIVDQEQVSSEADLKVSISATTSGGTYSINLPVVYKDSVVYMDLGGLDALKEAVGVPEDQRSTVTWVKFTPEEFETAAENSSAENFSQADIEVNSILQSIDLEQLEKFVREHPAFKQTGVVGKEELRGAPTYKYRLEYDPENMRKVLEYYVDTMFQAADAPQVEGTDSTALQSSIKQMLGDFVQKFQFDSLYVWVGAKDYRMHKAEGQGKVFSLVSFMNSLSSTFDSVLALDKDGEQKLSDVSQIGFALDLYKNEFGGFPAAAEGVAVGLAPNFLPQWPTAPPPTGVCSEWDNTYWYTPKGEPQDGGKGVQVFSDYEFTFCLEKPYGGFPSGAGAMTPGKGILVNGREACFGDSCENFSGKPEDLLTDFFSKVNFSAELSYTLEQYDFDQAAEVRAPEGAYDLGAQKPINQEEPVSTIPTAADAVATQVISEVRQVLSSLELYHNDFQEYPDSLSQIVPKYMGEVFTMDAGGLGACSPENSKAAYQKHSPQTYELKFCLPVAAGGLTAGPHTASSSGME